jgi:hypothetical protein
MSSCGGGIVGQIAPIGCKASRQWASSRKGIVTVIVAGLNLIGRIEVWGNGCRRRFARTGRGGWHFARLGCNPRFFYLRRSQTYDRALYLHMIHASPPCIRTARPPGTYGCKQRVAQHRRADLMEERTITWLKKERTSALRRFASTRLRRASSRRRSASFLASTALDMRCWAPVRSPPVTVFLYVSCSFYVFLIKYI